MTPSDDPVDPEVRAALAGFFAVAGSGGLIGIEDLPERRAKLLELVALLEAQNPPSGRVVAEDRAVPGPADAPDVRIRIYRPIDQDAALPCVFHIHGGGMNSGSIDSERMIAEQIAEQVGCVTVSVGYRLAPENPHPAPIEDCYAGLCWVAESADELRIDSGRIAIYGASAGGGLAAGVALLARDRSGPPLAFQMLISPMLDDRNSTPSSREITDFGIWDRAANIEAWQQLLGNEAGSESVSIYAAPARLEELGDLPPTYIDVGQLDLFRDEDVDYGSRLMQARIPTELHVYPGAVHASDVLAPESGVARRVIGYRIAALRRAFEVRPAED